jgi:hypothetical protein
LGAAIVASARSARNEDRLAQVNAVQGERELRKDHTLPSRPCSGRSGPIPPRVVVATSQYPPQELATLFEEKRFFRARNARALSWLEARVTPVPPSR